MFDSGVFAAFGAVLTIIILIATGFSLSKFGKITPEISGFISWIVINVSLPCLMTVTILTSFDRSDLASIPRAVAAPALSIVLGYFAGFAVAKISKPASGRLGQTIVQTAQNNTIFMGLPVNIAMLGEVSVPYVLYYYIANTVFFWSLGVYLISEKKSKRGKNILSIFVTPPMFGIYIGAVCFVLGLNLPKFAMDSLRYLGNLTTPLSMIFIGHVLCRSGIKNLKIDKDVVVGLFSRFVIGPSIAICIYYFMGISGMMRDVFIVQSFMPVMANATIVADRYGTDSRYAAVMVSLSTIVALALLPLVRILFIG
ncbi:MAG: Membrane transport protein [Firmicutes bacterium ADurb.Bin193]|nr:MAG: Membrane transport protein [Firmicutes bacterium ADurb.Bin193]